MKIKVTVSPQEVNNQVEQYFKSHYQQFADYAEFIREQSKVELNIVQLLSKIEVKAQCLGLKNKLSLMHSKRGEYTQLDLFVLRQIKDSIKDLRQQN